MNTPKPVPSRPYAWVSTIAIVWGGELFSVLTSSIVQMGLIWHIAAQGGSAGTITLASMAGFLPLALIGPFAGVIVDRHPITATLIGSDLFIAAISLVVAMAALLGHAPVWLIMASLFLRAIGSSLHTPAFNALTPMVAPAEQLGRLSGIAQCVQSLGYIAGYAMAALLYPIFGLGVMALIDVVGALVASLAVWMTRLTTYVRPVSTTATDSEGLSVAVGRMLSADLRIRVLIGHFAGERPVPSHVSGPFQQRHLRSRDRRGRILRRHAGEQSCHRRHRRIPAPGCERGVGHGHIRHGHVDRGLGRPLHVPGVPGLGRGHGI